MEIPTTLEHCRRMRKQLQAISGQGGKFRAYTPHFVAAALSVHEETIRQALRTGRLPGVRLGNKWRITHSNLLALLRDGLPIKGSDARGPQPLNPKPRVASQTRSSHSS